MLHYLPLSILSKLNQVPTSRFDLVLDPKTRSLPTHTKITYNSWRIVKFLASMQPSSSIGLYPPSCALGMRAELPCHWMSFPIVFCQSWSSPAVTKSWTSLNFWPYILRVSLSLSPQLSPVHSFVWQKLEQHKLENITPSLSPCLHHAPPLSGFLNSKS